MLVVYPRPSAHPPTPATCCWRQLVADVAAQCPIPVHKHNACVSSNDTHSSDLSWKRLCPTYSLPLCLCYCVCLYVPFCVCLWLVLYFYLLLCLPVCLWLSILGLGAPRTLGTLTGGTLTQGPWTGGTLGPRAPLWWARAPPYFITVLYVVGYFHTLQEKKGGEKSSSLNRHWQPMMAWWRPMTANDDVMTADDDVMTADDDVMMADDDVMTQTTVQNILPIILKKYKINSKYYPIVSKLLPIHNIIIKHSHTKIQSISRASFVIIWHLFLNLYAFLTQ